MGAERPQVRKNDERSYEGWSEFLGVDKTLLGPCETRQMVRLCRGGEDEVGQVPETLCSGGSNPHILIGIVDS